MGKQKLEKKSEQRQPNSEIFFDEIKAKKNPTDKLRGSEKLKKSQQRKVYDWRQNDNDEDKFFLVLRDTHRMPYTETPSDALA